MKPQAIDMDVGLVYQGVAVGIVGDVAEPTDAVVACRHVDNDVVRTAAGCRTGYDHFQIRDPQVLVFEGRWNKRTAAFVHALQNRVIV